MMAATKNRTRQTAAVIPINGTPMPIRSPIAPAAFKDAKDRYPGFRHAHPGHVDQDLLVADEIQRGRKGVSGGGQDSDSDVGGKHGELQKLFRDAHDFTKMFLLIERVEHECRNRFAGQRETHLGRGTLPTSIARVVFLSETWSRAIVQSRPLACTISS